MATQNPLYMPGQYVQYNVTTQAPNAPMPSPAEQTIGMVRSAFTAPDGPYYQVIWNPGGLHPKTGLYSAAQLTALTQQEANSIIQQLAAGTYTPPSQIPSTNYQQPNIPAQAAPPGQQ